MGRLRLSILLCVSALAASAWPLLLAHAGPNPASGSKEASPAVGQADPAQGAAAPAPAPAAAAPGSACSPDAIAVNIAPSGGNNFQLGIQVNGSYGYPFEFTWNPAPSNGLDLSATGVITGTPNPATDTCTTITVKDSTGKPIAPTYEIKLHVGTAPIVMLGAAPAAAAAAAKSDAAKATIITNPIYAAGDTISGTVISSGSASKGNGGNSPNSSGTGNCPSGGATTTLYVHRDSAADAKTTTDCSGSFSYQFNTPFSENDGVTVSTEPIDKLASPSTQAVPRPNLFGEELRAIVGYQQAGASSAKFEQNWFLDFYISRPLAFGKYGPGGKDGEGSDHKWRWWGNVRIASFPQPGNQTIADLASGLATQIGSLKLNQLAEGGEFLAGIEYTPWTSYPFRGLSENTRQSFSLGLIAGFGATGFFTSPSSSVQVFDVPAPGSPAATVFQSMYGNVTTSRVGFVSPDFQRFPKQYLAGLRLTTHYFDPSGSPLTSAPAMLQLSAGQNQVISGGRFQGVIGRVEAFYPLPFGNRGRSVAGAFSSIYLFAAAQMRLGAAKIPPSLVLQPDTTPAYDPTVTLLPAPTTSDEYRFGFGVDLVSLISQLSGGAAKNAAAAASQAKPAQPPPPGNGNPPGQ